MLGALGEKTPSHILQLSVSRILVRPQGPLLPITRSNKGHSATQVPTSRSESVRLASKERSQASASGPSISDSLPKQSKTGEKIKVWGNLAVLERAYEVGRSFPHPMRLPRCPLPWRPEGWQKWHHHSWPTPGRLQSQTATTSTPCKAILLRVPS